MDQTVVVKKALSGKPKPALLLSPMVRISPMVGTDRTRLQMQSDEMGFSTG